MHTLAAKKMAAEITKIDSVANTIPITKYHDVRQVLQSTRELMKQTLHEHAEVCAQCRSEKVKSYDLGFGTCWPCEAAIRYDAPEDSRGQPSTGICGCGATATIVSDWYVSACPYCAEYHKENRPDD